MDPQELKIGTVVQLNPDTVANKMFAACFMIVEESKEWGVKGYVQDLGKNGKPGGQAYYRASWKEIEPVGFATWRVPLDAEEKKNVTDQ